MCECDLERPDIFEAVHRKARRQHRCSECSRAISNAGRNAIAPGSKYVAISALWDGHWGNFKQCLDCEAMGDRFMKETDCCYCVGDLYQDLIDSDFLNFDEETQRWESSKEWLQIVSQKPLRCVVVTEEALIV
ncbi:hypothetical protein H6G36_25390 [Anabaena minutissima FACHB-250]|nr:hypothetical protein [Anabaena minutissima FACHB-250]